MIVFVKCRRSESKMFQKVVCLCGLQWLCLVTNRRENRKAYCMSLQTAMIVFVKCRR